MIALPRERHRGLPDMCCCEWDFVNWVRIFSHPECATHGPPAVRARARQEKQQKLRLARITAWEHRKTMRAELALLPAKITECTTLIDNLTQQLKELGE